jgi:hypothetical protein
MPDAPGHTDILPRETSIAALISAEYPGNVFALGGFFAEKQTHWQPRLVDGDYESTMPLGLLGISWKTGLWRERFGGGRIAEICSRWPLFHRCWLRI